MRIVAGCASFWTSPSTTPPRRIRGSSRRLAIPHHAYRNYYLFSENGRYAAAFSSRMPDLNFDEPAVRREIKSIAKFWLDRGIDGFRLDAAKHIYEDPAKNTQWWREFSEYVHGIHPRALLIGEVLGSGDTRRAHAQGLSSMLDDLFMKRVEAQVVEPKAGFLKRWLEESNGYEPYVFVASHDENPRLASFLEQRGKLDAYPLAMYVLFLVSKHPVLYQGDEIMQRGVKWDGAADGSRIYDETLREPFQWFKSIVKPPQTTWFPPRYDRANDGVSVEEQRRRGGMIPLVRNLAKFRADHPDFATGDITEVIEDSDTRLVFRKGPSIEEIEWRHGSWHHRTAGDRVRGQQRAGTRVRLLARAQWSESGYRLPYSGNNPGDGRSHSNGNGRASHADCR